MDNPTTTHCKDLQNTVIATQKKFPFESYIRKLNKIINDSLNEGKYSVAVKAIEISMKYLCYDKYAPVIVDNDDINSADSIINLINKVEKLESKVIEDEND